MNDSDLDIKIKTTEYAYVYKNMNKSDMKRHFLHWNKLKEIVKFYRKPSKL